MIYQGLFSAISIQVCFFSQQHYRSVELHMPRFLLLCATEPWIPVSLHAYQLHLPSILSALIAAFIQTISWTFSCFFHLPTVSNRWPNTLRSYTETPATKRNMLLHMYQVHCSQILSDTRHYTARSRNCKDKQSP